jgi:uncharacterized protein YecE (DUF72 family)
VDEEQKRLIEERRARREARRQKQRDANTGRAVKMRAARIEFERDRRHIGAAASAAVGRTPAAKAAAPIELRIGCSGWYYWHWRDCFYPSHIAQKDWFDFYTRNFDTVELNAPFYSWPTVATVRTWLRQARSRNFVYTVKVNELITHRRQMSGCKLLVRDFGHIADLLAERMGCFLFQFPPSFRYTPARLRRIVESLDPDRRNVVEFRHKSWWNEKVYDALRKVGAIFCSCSGPRLPDELIKTADEIYVRFHGTKRWYRHDYTDEELAVWAGRIVASGAKRLWAYFNNDRDCYAIKNARALKALLARPVTRQRGKTPDKSAAKTSLD